MPETHVWKLTVKVDGEALSDDAFQRIGSFSWKESINEPPTGSLVFDTDDRTEDALKVEDCIGKEIEVTLTNPHDEAVTVFKGEVHAAEQAGRRDATGSWTLVFRHKAHRLTQQSQCKMWMSGDYGDHKASDVVKQVIENAGLSAKKVDASQLSRAAFQQYRETDFNFLQRLVEDMGMWLVFAHDASGDVSVTKSHEFATTIETAPRYAWEPWLLDWHVSSATTPNALGVRTPPNPKETRVGGADESETLSDQESAGRKAFGELKVAEYDASPESQDHAKTHAKSMLYSLGGPGLRLSGAVLNLPLFSGDVVKMKGGPVEGGTGLATEFFVTEAEVHYNESGVETQFTGHMKDDKILPPRKAIRPRIGGVAVAVVTNSERSTLEQGRVKVKFPWLTDAESAWLRIAQPWAGKERGAWFLPRVDDEVLVAFEQGDPDRPFIIGSLHNSKDKPPIPLPSEWTKSIIRTVKEHHLVFEDKDGEEFVEIQTGLEQHNLRFDDKNKAVTMKSGAGHTLHFDDEGKTIELHSTGGLEVTMDDNGQSVTIKALQSMTLECGPSKIELKPDGITIKGMKVDVQADTMATVKGVTAEVNGSAQLTLKGGVTMIN
jgi:type VI secretion system secreted protein VgrG